MGSSTNTPRPESDSGQRLHVRHRLVGVLVAGDPDETHLGLRHQRLRGLHHAQPGPQHRHQQRRVRQPIAQGPGHRRVQRRAAHRGVPGRLVDQHQGEVAQRGPEGGVVGAGVAHRGQPGLGQGMVDDPHVHGAEHTGPRKPPTASGQRERGLPPGRSVDHVDGRSPTSPTRTRAGPARRSAPGRRARPSADGRRRAWPAARCSASAAGKRRRYPVTETTSIERPGGRPSSASGTPRQSCSVYQPPVQSSTARTVRCGRAGQRRPGRAPGRPARSRQRPASIRGTGSNNHWVTGTCSGRPRRPRASRSPAAPARRHQPQRGRARGDPGRAEGGPPVQVGAAQQRPPARPPDPVVDQHVPDEQQPGRRGRAHVQLHRQQSGVGAPAADRVQQPTRDGRQDECGQRETDHFPRPSGAAQPPFGDSGLRRKEYQQSDAGDSVDRDNDLCQSRRSGAEAQPAARQS